MAELQEIHIIKSIDKRQDFPRCVRHLTHPSLWPASLGKVNSFRDGQRPADLQEKCVLVPDRLAARTPLRSDVTRKKTGSQSEIDNFLFSSTE